MTINDYGFDNQGPVRKLNQTIFNAKIGATEKLSHSRLPQLNETQQRKAFSTLRGKKNNFEDLESTAYASKNYQNNSLNRINNTMENVEILINQAIADLQIDIQKKPIERNDILRIATNLGVIVSPFQSYEALFFSRQNSKDPSNYQNILLITWFSRNLPVLRPLGQN